MSGCAVQRLPMNPQKVVGVQKFFEFLNEKLDQLETESSMDKSRTLPVRYFKISLRFSGV